MSSPLKLGDRLRKELIVTDLITACQRGLITGDEYHRARQLLHATDWKLQNVVGVPTDLLAKILRACPLLNESSAPVAPTPMSEEQPAKITAPTNSIDPDEGFGLQPQPPQHKDQ